MLAPEPEDVPWGHGLQVCDPETDAYFPASQEIHVLIEVALEIEEYFPGEQLVPR